MLKTNRRLLRYLGAVAFVLSLVLLGACGDAAIVAPDHPQSTFDTSGPVARSQLALFYWIFGAAAFVFVTVVSVLLFIVFRFRRRPGDADPPQIHGNRRLEIGWTILPVVVLAVVAFPTVTTIFDNANSPEPGALTIDVVGHQWWWEFRYPHPDDANDVLVTANEMHIPVGEVVNINLESKDVIHSFWIPKLAGKVDMVPNNPNTMWIEADKPDVYLGQCAEFCGNVHALMRFRVVAESRTDFDRWLSAEAEPADVPVEPLAVEGRAIFEGDGECWACHTVEGSSKARGTKGPNLTHVTRRSHIGAGIRENNQPNLRAWLTDPNSVKPGNVMFTDAAVYNDPQKSLKESDISALVAYLRSLY